MISRAVWFKSFLLSGPPQRYVGPYFVDSKPVWLLLVASVHGLIDHPHLAVNILSVVIGVETVWLTFQFTTRLYGSSELGLLSALFLAVSPLHVYFSRLALPEAMSCLLFLGGMYFYLIGQRRHDHNYIILTGLVLALAVLTNRFRVMLFPLGIVLMEIVDSRRRSEQIIRRGKRILLFILSVIVTFVAFEIFLYLLNFSGIHIQPYSSMLHSSFSRHDAVFDPSSIALYPFYLLKTEGLLALALLAGGMFFVRAENSSLFPLGLVLIQVLVSSLVDEKALRAISVISPFMSILMAVCVFHVLQKFSGPQKSRVITGVVVVVIVGANVVNVKDVYSFRSDHFNAVNYVDENFEHTGILSLNAPMFRVFHESVRVDDLLPYDLNRLSSAGLDGYGAIVLDPQLSVIKMWQGEGLVGKAPGLLGEIETKCHPKKIYDHFGESLMEVFIMEHNVHPYPELRSALGGVDASAGRIYIYSLEECVETLGDR
jgi:hypothetical protein